MKKKLLKELEEKFEEEKKETGFSSTLDDIDGIFFIRDFVLSEGYVSENLTRQICGRMIETYMGWTNYIHSLIMPNPQNVLNLSEARLFCSEEKQEMNRIMKMAMSLSSRSSWVGLTKNKTEEAKFIDDAVRIWKEEFSVALIKILDKVRQEWEK